MLVVYGSSLFAFKVRQMEPDVVRKDTIATNPETGSNVVSQSALD